MPTWKLIPLTMALSSGTVFALYVVFSWALNR